MKKLLLFVAAVFAIVGCSCSQRPVERLSVKGTALVNE